MTRSGLSGSATTSVPSIAPSSSLICTHAVIPTSVVFVLLFFFVRLFAEIDKRASSLREYVLGWGGGLEADIARMDQFVLGIIRLRRAEHSCHVEGTAEACHTVQWHLGNARHVRNGEECVRLRQCSGQSNANTPIKGA